jgi:hypothetical protein
LSIRGLRLPSTTHVLFEVVVQSAHSFVAHVGSEWVSETFEELVYEVQVDKVQKDGWRQEAIESRSNLIYMKAWARVLLQSDLNKAHAHMTQFRQQGVQRLRLDTL